MGYTVIKLDRGEDCYMVWSFVVDNVVEVGPRDVIEASFLWRGEVEPVAEKLARADKIGSSDRGSGTWDSPGLVVRNDPEGWLPREKFRAYALAAGRDEFAIMRALVEPIGDTAELLALDEPD